MGLFTVTNGGYLKISDVSFAVNMGAGAPACVNLFESTTSGDWNDGGTWGNTSPGVECVDYPSTAGGDVVVISAGDEVTVPDGYSASAGPITLTGSITSDWGKLVVSGSLALLSGNLLLEDYTEIAVVGTGTLDLDGNNLSTYKRNAGDHNKFTFSGSSPTSRARIISTTPGGLIYPIGTGWGYHYVDFNWHNFDFEDLGDCYIERRTLSDTVETISNITWANSGRLYVLHVTTGPDDWVMENCDFTGSTHGSEILRWVIPAQAGKLRQINNCTFGDSTSTARYFGSAIEDLVISGCVFHNIGWYALNSPNQTMTSSVCAWDMNATLWFTNLQDGDAINNNYIYLDSSNPHTFQCAISTTSSAPIIISGNIVEATYDALPYIDVGEHILPSQYNPMTIYRNLFIDSGGSVVMTSTSGVKSGAYTLKRNTYMGKAASQDEGMLIRTYTTGHFTGSITASNNLIVDSADSGNSRGVNFEADNRTDQISYADYNNWYQVTTPYYDVTMSARVEGDPGFGGYSQSVDPQFVDDTRDFAAFDASVGGAGTSANAITEFMKLNKSDYDSNYNTVDLLNYVRAGFEPQNTQLFCAGDPLDGSPDIGAIDAPVCYTYWGCGYTSPGTVFQYDSRWNYMSNSVDLSASYACDGPIFVNNPGARDLAYSGSNWYVLDVGYGTRVYQMTQDWVNAGTDCAAKYFIVDHSTDNGITAESVEVSASSIYVGGRASAASGGHGVVFEYAISDLVNAAATPVQTASFVAEFPGVSGHIHAIRQGLNGNWYMLNKDASKIYEYAGSFPNWGYTGNSYTTLNGAGAGYNVYGMTQMPNGDWVVSDINFDVFITFNSSFVYQSTKAQSENDVMSGIAFGTTGSS